MGSGTLVAVRKTTLHSSGGMRAIVGWLSLMLIPRREWRSEEEDITSHSRTRDQGMEWLNGKRRACV